MNGEVNVDFEDVLSIVTNGTYSITPVESGSEWLTTSCVKSAYDEILN